MRNWWWSAIGSSGGTAQNGPEVVNMMAGIRGSCELGTVVEIFLNCFSITCAFHLSDFRLSTRFIGTVVLSSSTWSSCPFSFRTYEAACMCSPISVLSHKEVREYAQLPRVTHRVNCYAFYSMGKRNITQRGTVTQYGTKECISVMYRTETLRNILCRRNRAMPKKIGKPAGWCGNSKAAAGLSEFVELQAHR